VTATEDPAQAQSKIDEDPQIKAQLQQRLAEIAQEELKERNRANEEAQRVNLELYRFDAEERERVRQEEFQQYLPDLQDRQEARTMEMRLADNGSPLAWVSPILAFALVAMIFYLLHSIMTAREDFANKDVFNVVLGALVTAFTTVVSYYFGSSLGSSKKGAALHSGQLVSNLQGSGGAGVPPPPPPPATSDGKPPGKTADGGELDPGFRTIG
jgi:hypothetical protein